MTSFDPNLKGIYIDDLGDIWTTKPVEITDMDMDAKLKLYAEAMAADPAAFIEDLNARLIELDDMLYREHCCSEVGFSLDDIDLWARLCSITIIQGVAWPAKLRTYG